MVKFTNALVATVLIVPALSAPTALKARDVDNSEVIQSREPYRFGGGGGRFGGHRGGPPQQRSLEAREPRIPVNGLGHAPYKVQPKSTLPNVIIGREPRFHGGMGFGGGRPHGPPQQRDLAEAEIMEAREPMIPGLPFPIQRKPIIARDDSTLESREPRFRGGMGFGGGRPHGPPQQRDIVEAREPVIQKTGFTTNHVAHLIPGMPWIAIGRDESNLEAREPRFGLGGFAKHFGHGMGAGMNAPQQQQRDFEDGANSIEAREPRFGGFLKHLGHGLGSGMNSQQQQQQQRDFDDSEIEAREPRFGFGGFAKHFGHGMGAGMNAPQQQQRDFDDSEIEAREPVFPKFFGHGPVVNTRIARDMEIDELD